MFKMIKIFNTLSTKKDILRPFKKRKINLFVCGPTVYDLSHIGHARTYIFFDCFVKYLKKKGMKVFYLQNITDIDDKIIKRAKEKRMSPKSLADFFTKQYFEDMELINVNSVNRYAKATGHIEQIIIQIQRLLAKDYAYKLDDGIYYNTVRFKNYGKLSGRTTLQAEDAISRIDEEKEKKNKGDFCLWKFTKEGEPSWPSPFGLGRPGWHIEDTAITEKFFGEQYDIHGGARDLIFPHHEAEIAQMEAISGKKPLAKYWMHTGFLTIGGQKMSKSLHNSITIEEFLKKYPSHYLRFWVAIHLWRQPIDYSESSMAEVKAILEKVEELIRKIQNPKSKLQINSKFLNSKTKRLILKAKNDFYKNLDDDFNTPKAFAVMFDLIKKANTLIDKELLSKKEANQIYKFFEEINKIFGFIDFEHLKESSVPAEIKKLMQDRERCRKNKDWQKADEIRKQIESKGFTIEDTKEGPTLKRISRS